MGLGRIDVDVGTGICKERDSAGVRWTWAILELDIEVNTVEIAFARLDCDKTCWYIGAKVWLVTMMDTLAS